VNSFKVLFRNLPRETEENCRILSHDRR